MRRRRCVQLAACRQSLVLTCVYVPPRLHSYMVLELALGGELFSVLANTEDGVIPEASCLFYSACVLSGLECMHSHNILYRDMKPENMMLDADGYIKVRAGDASEARVSA